MRCDELYLDENIEQHTFLFNYAYDDNYNLVDFVDKFMRSKLRRYMEEGDPVLLTKDGIEIYEQFDKSGISTCELQDPFEVEWIAEFYCRLQWSTGIPGAQLVEMVAPVKEVHFGYMHKLQDYDPADVVEKWMIWHMKFSGIYDENSELIIAYHQILDKYGTSIKKVTLVNEIEDLCKRNARFKWELKQTESAVIALCCSDQIYGIGMSNTDENRFYKDKWLGKNLYGECLMHVRDTVKS